MIVFGYTVIARKQLNDDQGSRTSLQPRHWILIGFFGVFAALGPEILVGRQVYLDLVFNGFNKYTLHASIGVSVFIVSLLLALTHQKSWIAVVASFLRLSVHMNRSEWLPVFEAYANLGRYKEAKQLATIIRGDKDLQHFLCRQIEVESGRFGYNYEYIYTTLCENP